MARQADESGFFYVAVCDHTAIPRRLAEAMSTTWYDTIATLGWLAGITTRIRLMSHVYIAAQRHPLRAAKEFATLDVLSGGRVIIGVGAGHVNEEFDLFGPPFDERGQALDEAIDAIAVGADRRVPRPGRPALAGERSRGLAPARPAAEAPDLGGRLVPGRRCAGPRTRGDGWLPQTVRRSDMRDQVAELLELRQDLRGGAPIEIGALGRDLPRRGARS